MWHTPAGERHLQGAEAELLKESIGLIWDGLEEEIRHPDNPWECGVRIFDDMDGRQKLAMLASVGAALLRADVPQLPLNAVNEGTVAAIFETLPVNVESEIDAEDLDWSDHPDMELYRWRRLVRASFIIDGVPAEYDLPAPECTDLEEWKFMIECLADRILWDDDWSDEEIMDADPETAAARKRRLGIEKDYYLAVAPDPTEQELEKARDTLRELLKEGQSG